MDASSKYQPPGALHLRFCEGCGRSAYPGDMTLGAAHNPSWPDASPIVCQGPVSQLTYVLQVGP